MDYMYLFLYGIFTLMFNIYARYITTNKKEHKYLKPEFLKAFLIIPPKGQILLKPFINYVVHLILFIILAIFYACGLMFIKDFPLIIWIIFTAISFISLIFTGVLTRFYY